nr:hypothetical protein [uncultured Celeribacter sp.]
MRDEWILDVLADLRAFAEMSGLNESAEQLHDTSLVIAAELAKKSAEVQTDQAGTHGRKHAELSGGYPAS